MKNQLILALGINMFLCCLAAPAQSTSSGGTGDGGITAPLAQPVPLDRDARQDARLERQFAETHPNWATNHPQLAQFYKTHPQAQDRAIDRYGDRQFARKHPGWVADHPNLSKFDYRHPEWSENHPRKALGLGNRLGAGLGRGRIHTLGRRI